MDGVPGARGAILLGVKEGRKVHSCSSCRSCASLASLRLFAFSIANWYIRSVSSAASPGLDLETFLSLRWTFFGNSGLKVHASARARSRSNFTCSARAFASSARSYILRTATSASDILTFLLFVSSTDTVAGAVSGR